MKSLRVRPASPADLQGVCLIEDNSFSDPYPRHLFNRLLHEAGNTFLVAEEAPGNLIGYCVSSREGRLTHLISIAVLTKGRRKGVATALLRKLIECLGRQRIDELWLEVKERNKEAITLYGKFGFESMMILENYYSDGSSALRMRMSLNKEALRVERNPR